MADDGKTRQQRIADEIAGRQRRETEPEGFDDLPAAEPRDPESIRDPETAERRQRMLAGFDPEIAKLFSDEDLAKIEAEEKRKVAEDRRKLAIDDLRQRARLEAQIESGLVPAARLRDEAEQARLDETVRIRVNLPGGGAGHRDRHGFRINGRIFQQGQVYEVTRAEYDSLNEAHYRIHLNEIRFATMNQDQPGNSAPEIAGRVMPRLEIAA